MKITGLFIGLVIITLGACGCAGTPAAVTKVCSTPATAGTPQIPEGVLAAADQFVISRLGKTYFDGYVCFAPEFSGYAAGDPACLAPSSGCAAFLARDRYDMCYSLQLPGMPARQIAQFVVDTAGNLIPEGDVSGLPDCVRYPKECLFKVKDAESAKAIAEKAGLEAGLEAWSTNFTWYGGDLGTYVWSVQNTLQSNSSGGVAYGSAGRIMTINANSGDVLQANEWVLIP